MPINPTQANDEVGAKTADGDMGALFQKALGMRWTVIDEISAAVSPLLLGLLMRACGERACDILMRAAGDSNVRSAGSTWRSQATYGNCRQ